MELPGDGRHKRLQYSQILPGAIRGALEMVHLEVKPVFGSPGRDSGSIRLLDSMHKLMWTNLS